MSEEAWMSMVVDLQCARPAVDEPAKYVTTDEKASLAKMFTKLLEN